MNIQHQPKKIKIVIFVFATVLYVMVLFVGLRSQQIIPLKLSFFRIWVIWGPHQKLIGFGSKVNQR